MHYAYLVDANTDALSIQSMERTEDGFLEVWGVAAVPGVLVYPEDDDRRDLVTPKALSSDRSLDSLQKATVVMEHPDESKVDPSNNKREQVGEVLDADYEDDQQRVHLIIKNEDAIDAVEQKIKTGLSPGYDPEYKEESGEHEEYGEYDKIQVNRRNNHLAITSTPRGEDETTLHVDSKGQPPMDEEVKDALDALNDRLDAMEEKMGGGEDAEDSEDSEDADDGSNVDMDKLLKMVKKMHDDMYGESGESGESEDAEDTDDSVQDAARELARARQAADKLDVDYEDDTPTDEIKQAVIQEHAGVTIQTDSVDQPFEDVVEALSEQTKKSRAAQTLEDSFEDKFDRAGDDLVEDGDDEELFATDESDFLS